jgi:hypothetical protein
MFSLDGTHRPSTVRLAMARATKVPKVAAVAEADGVMGAGAAVVARTGLKSPYGRLALLTGVDAVAVDGAEAEAGAATMDLSLASLRCPLPFPVAAVGVATTMINPSHPPCPVFFPHRLDLSRRLCQTVSSPGLQSLSRDSD